MASTATALIAEDHPETVRICRETLAGNGWAVDEASTVNEAFARIRQARPAVLLLDAALDPDRVASLCSAAKSGSRTRVLLLLPPRAAEADFAELTALADASLQKPFTRQALTEIVQVWAESLDEPSGVVYGVDDASGRGLLRAADGAVAFPLDEVGGCTLERVIGRGGMGTVYRARHGLLGISVAVKLVYAPRSGWSDEDARRFIRGAQAAARIHHPNIVPVLNAGREGDFYYLVQRYIDGTPLADEIALCGTVPEDVMRGIMADVAAGLSAVHGAGIVHRDVKPSNIILAKDGRAMLLDFGLARDGELRDISGASEIVGTPYYMAPEQCEGRPVTNRTDLYGLGVAAYEALAGKRPFRGETPLLVLRAHVEAMPVHLSEAAPNVSESLAAVVMQLLRKDPQDRYASSEALSEALAALS